MTDFKELLQQRPDESSHDWAIRLFSSDPTGETVARENHIDKEHKVYVCHCKQSIVVCKDASHIVLPGGHSWELVNHPIGKGYLPVLKCDLEPGKDAHLRQLWRSTRCRECGNKIRMGSRLVGCEGYGVKHVDCSPGKELSR